MLSLLAPTLGFMGSALTGRRRWVAPLSPLGGPERTTPPWLAGLVCHDLDLATQLDRPGGHVAIVEDRSDRTVSVVMRAYGEGFIVAGRANQDGRLDAWGVALADTCREGHCVTRVTVSQWAAPAGNAEHRSWLDSAMVAGVSSADRDSYEEVLGIAGRSATRTEVLLSVSVAMAGVRVLAHHHGDKLLAASERAVDYAEMLRRRLGLGELVVSAPLTPPELATAIRFRCDPSGIEHVEGRARALGGLAGVVSIENAYPLESVVGSASLQLDGSLHRVFRVAEWPREEVRADWLRDFLGAPGVVRLFSVQFMGRSRAKAKREVGFRATMSEVGRRRRDQKGNRVGAEQEMAHQALGQIDHELAQGAGLIHYVGLVVVSSPDLLQLDYDCEVTVQAAQHVGMELRLVRRRQGAGMAAGLGIGRGVHVGVEL